MSDTSPTPELPVEMPTAPAAPVRTKNTLALPQFLKLADWCRSYRDDCATKTYPDLADIATATLKFTVTPANMSSTIEACDIERIKPDAPPTLEQQIAALRDRLDKAESDSKALRGNLGEILAAMHLRTARVERLEMHHEQPIIHPDLPGLPVPAFGETGTTALIDGTPPFRPEHYAKSESLPHFPGDSALTE